MYLSIYLSISRNDLTEDDAEVIPSNDDFEHLSAKFHFVDLGKHLERYPIFIHIHLLSRGNLNYLNYIM